MIDDFPVGRRESLEVTITEAMIDAFAALSGDVNTLHLDESEAKRAGFPRRVAHGCLTLSFVSTLIGTRLPGHGALWRSVEVDWQKPVFPGDRLTLTGTVVTQSRSAESIVLEILGVNQIGSEVLKARAAVGLTGSGAAVQLPENVALAARPATATQVRTTTGRAQRPVLITGASRGIGRGIALELAAAGHPIGVGYLHRSDEARAVVEQIRAAQGHALAVAVNVAAPATIAPAIDALQAELGPVLAVVHAATPPLDYTPAADLTNEVMQPFWDVYVRGAIDLMRATLPAMKASKWGRFVFLGSSMILGTPPAKLTAYLTAKNALVGLTRSLALELGPLGITTNLISPSMTLTDLSREVSPRAQLVEAQRNPLRRLATPEDTAKAIAFVLGDEGGFLNGVHLPVTGGSAVL